MREDKLWNPDRQPIASAEVVKRKQAENPDRKTAQKTGKPRWDQRTERWSPDRD